MAKKAPNIELPSLNVRLGGLNLLASDAYRSFDFIADEDSFLPRCVIRLSDKGGDAFRSFLNLSIGTKVEVTITEASDTKERKSGVKDNFSMNLTNLAIGAVYSNSKVLGFGDGGLEILCEHPWSIAQDFSPHAYAGKSNSEIIKSLVQNTSARGFGFEKINSEIFQSTDEDGNIPRYNCGEGDLSFIVNKLLPYTTVNNNPVVFFVDDKNNVHLESFQSMFSREAKLLIVGGNEEDVDDEIRAKAKSLGGLAVSSNLLAKIGDKNPDKFTKILKREISMDDCSALVTYTGKLLPKVAIAKHSQGSKSSKGYIPVSFDRMITSDATDKVCYTNHMYEDLKAAALNEQKDFNSLFKIDIDVSFCGHLVSVGDNVEIKIPVSKSEDGDTVNHWMDGKWHIKAIKYKWDPTSGVPGMTLTLTRPSFVFNSTTTIANRDEFYGVGMTLL